MPNNVSLFIKRFKWRLRNLTFKDLVLSYFPATLTIDKIDYDYYRQIVNKITPLENRDFDTKNLFLIIKPSGLQYRDKINSVLKQKGISIVKEHEINDYIRFQLTIYKLHNMNRPDYETKFLNQVLWLESDKKQFPETYNKAIVLVLDNVNSVQTRDLKNYIRRKVGRIKFTRIVHDDKTDTVFSSYVHVPDKDELGMENAVIKSIVKT
jgi:hypothetical protein